jgi:hypothetical protein
MDDNAERMTRANDFFDRVYDSDSDSTQCEYALEYLKTYGSITPLEALRAFGCMRLGARIADLRADGYDIETEINPKGKRYAIYRFAE